MGQEKIEKLIATIDNIPPLPEISTAVMTELKNEEVSIIEVSELIERDVSLATQILKVANSPAYGATNTISSIQHAIMMLGLQEVKSLLLAFAVQEFFTTDAKNTELRKRFWTHSRVCSYTALLLAHHFKQGDTSTFFLSGLIHDIGKLIIDQFMHDEFQQVIWHITKHNCSFSEAEKQLLGMTHYQIGGKLLQHWNFPQQVIMQVFRHHVPWKESEFTSGAFIIFMADVITKLAGYTCLEEERQLTIEQFCKSKAMHFIHKHGFKLDAALLENFIQQINEFVAVDAS